MSRAPLVSAVCALLLACADSPLAPLSSYSALVARVDGVPLESFQRRDQLTSYPIAAYDTILHMLWLGGADTIRVQDIQFVVLKFHGPGRYTVCADGPDTTVASVRRQPAADPDSVEQFFAMAPCDDGFLIVDSVSLAGGTIAGRFEFTARPWTSASPRVQVREGRFEGGLSLFPIAPLAGVPPN